ncbi:hypothetical protein B7494_g231 [Chlorociboria aeruginascens]|nr:hypothetical protein B7494_g231 [Chlorociboria aeruginascens]
MEGEMSRGPSPPVSIKLERQGEGNYASTAISHTRDQETIHGLTLPPKIQSDDPWHFDAGDLINDEDVEALFGPGWPGMCEDGVQKEADVHTSLLEHDDSQLSDPPSQRWKPNDKPSSSAIVTGVVEDIMAKKQSVSRKPAASRICLGALAAPQGLNCRQNEGIDSERSYHHVSAGDVLDGINSSYLSGGLDREACVQGAIQAHTENEERPSARSLGEGDVMESLPEKRVPWNPDMPIASIEGRDIPSYEFNGTSKNQFGCRKVASGRSREIYSAVALEKNGCLEPSGTRKNHKSQHELVQTSDSEQRNPQIPLTPSHGVAQVAMADSLDPPNRSRDLSLPRVLAAHEIPTTFLPLLENIYVKISEEIPYRLSCLKFLSQKGVLIRGDSTGDYVVLKFGAASQTEQGQIEFDQDYNQGLDGLSSLQSAKELIKAERRIFQSEERDLQAQIKDLQRQLNESHPQISPPSQLSSSSCPQTLSEAPLIDQSRAAQVEVSPSSSTTNKFWKCLFPALDGSICGGINTDWYRHQATWRPRLRCAMCSCACYGPHREYIDPETAAVLGADMSEADMTPITKLQKSRRKESSITPGIVDDYKHYLEEMQTEKLAQELAQQQNMSLTGATSIPKKSSTNKSKPSSHSRRGARDQSNGASLTINSNLTSYSQSKQVASSHPTPSYQFDQASSTKAKQISRYCSLSPPQMKPRSAPLGSLTLPMAPSVSNSHVPTSLALQTPLSSKSNVTISNFSCLATNTHVSYGASHPLLQSRTQTEYRSPYPEIQATRKRKASDEDEVLFVSSRPRLTQLNESNSSTPSTILSSSTIIGDHRSQGSGNRRESQSSQSSHSSKGNQGKRATRQNTAQQRISDAAAPSGTTATLRAQLPGTDRDWMRPAPQQIDSAADQTEQSHALAESSEIDSLFGDCSEEIGGDTNADLDRAAWEAELEADLTAELERQGF